MEVDSVSSWAIIDTLASSVAQAGGNSTQIEVTNPENVTQAGGNSVPAQLTLPVPDDKARGDSAANTIPLSESSFIMIQAGGDSAPEQIALPASDDSQARGNSVASGASIITLPSEPDSVMIRARGDSVPSQSPLPSYEELEHAGGNSVQQKSDDVDMQQAEGDFKLQRRRPLVCPYALKLWYCSHSSS